MPLVGDRACTDHVRRPRRAEPRRSVVILGKRQRLARFEPMALTARLLVDFEAAEPFIDVCDKARLRVFTVVDDVDAELGLLVHDLRHRLAQTRVVCLRVECHTFLSGIHHRKKISRPRQAADMSGEDAVAAAFHDTDTIYLRKLCVAMLISNWWSPARARALVRAGGVVPAHGTSGGCPRRQSGRRRR